MEKGGTNSLLFSSSLCHLLCHKPVWDGVNTDPFPMLVLHPKLGFGQNNKEPSPVKSPQAPATPLGPRYEISQLRNRLRSSGTIIYGSLI